MEFKFYCKENSPGNELQSEKDKGKRVEGGIGAEEG